MVFDEPPAPAAREELGFATCEPAARRLFMPKSAGLRSSTYQLTEFEHQEAWLRQTQRGHSCGWSQSQTAILLSDIN